MTKEKLGVETLSSLGTNPEQINKSVSSRSAEVLALMNKAEKGEIESYEITTEYFEFEQGQSMIAIVTGIGEMKSTQKGNEGKMVPTVEFLAKEKNEKDEEVLSRKICANTVLVSQLSKLNLPVMVEITAKDMVEGKTGTYLDFSIRQFGS